MTVKKSFWLTTQGLSLLALVGAIAYFLVMDHREHIIEFLPYFILLACPLMHLMMHRGHSHHKHDEKSAGIDAAYRQGVEDGRKEVINNHSIDTEKK